MTMQATISESDITSNAPFSSSPKPYYVESPSPDDNTTTDDKYCSSTNSRSPSNFPFFPSWSASSASTAASHVSGNRRWCSKEYHDVVDDAERGVYDVDDINFSRPLTFVFGFGMAFAALCLILWVASRPYKIQVQVKSLMVHNLYFGEGSDRTGVPTKFITVNSSVHMFIYNRATFFGVRVSFNTVNLLFSEVMVATGQVGNYYQPKKSGRDMWMRLEGKGIPLYGSGAAMEANDSGDDIPMVLELGMQTRGYVVGKLVRTEHTRHVLCKLLINSDHAEHIMFSRNSCSYT